MFDELIDIFSLHNLFMPLTSFVKDLTNGPSAYLFVSMFAVDSKRQVRKYLEDNGIEVWGDLYNDQWHYVFNVRQADEERAKQLLRQRGWIE